MAGRNKLLLFGGKRYVSDVAGGASVANYCC
jgi:hypothetical protein